MGPGNPKYIFPFVYKIVQNSDMVVGANRCLQNFDLKNKKVIPIQSSINQVVDSIQKNRDKIITVIASGDPLFFGIARTFQRFFSINELNIEPGVSSVQYLLSKLGKSLPDYHLNSMHGQTQDVSKLIQQYKKIILLTDKKHNPQMIIDELIKLNQFNFQMTVGYQLSYENEKIICGSPVNILAQLPDDPLSIVVIERKTECITE